MKQTLILLTALVLELLTSLHVAGQNMDATDTRLPSWEFNNRNNFEGWTVPTPLGGTVEAGALWIKPAGYKPEGNPTGAVMMSDKPVPNSLKNSGWTWKPYEIVSPPDIQCPSERAKKLQLRLLNLSSETDGYIYWRTSEEPEKWLGPVRFTMNPYNNQWQDVTCHLDDIEWKGRLNQMRLCIGRKGVAGDIFIDQIMLKNGSKRVKPDRPTILGKDGVPRIKVPGLSQESIDAAYAVLNDAVVYDQLPINGFPYPLLAPGADGAGYGKSWWVMDGALGIMPLVWTDPSFAIRAIEGYMHIQGMNPDGRFTHGGNVAMRGLPGDMDGIPIFFESASAIARISTDKIFVEKVYRSMRRYLDWWLSPVKLDKTTGLVSGWFEESFSPPQMWAPGLALQVDLNVALAVGADLTRAMAVRLGYSDDALKLEHQRDGLIKAINTTLWSEKEQCYLNFDITTGKHEKMLSSCMFNCFRLQIAPPERREAMIKRLIDPDEFGWGKIPSLTSVSRKDKDNFIVRRGTYSGLTSYQGMVWTFRNIPIIQGLRDIGRHDLAAELCWNTLRAFDQNYAEFLDPNDGSAQGVKRYTFTAAQWIQCLIEQLFGVTYDAGRKTLTCFPHVPVELYGQTLSLQNLVLPGTNGAMVGIEISTSSDGLTTEVIVNNKRGLLPEGTSIEISNAGPANLVTENGKSLKGRSVADGSVAWNLPFSKTLKVRMNAGQ